MQLSESNIALRNLSAIVDFSNNINSNLNLKFAINNLLLTCFGKLQITKGMVVLFDSDKELQIVESKGISNEILEKFLSIKNGNNTVENLKAFISQNDFLLCEKIESSNNLLGFLILGKKITKQEFSTEDKQFLDTIINISSTTIQNIQNFDELTNLNKKLDSKVNQLNSIFDLGKEFGSILEIEHVSKLLIYSISAQMLVSKYAIILFSENEKQVLDSKYEDEKLKIILDSKEIEEIAEPKLLNEDNDFCKECAKLGIALIVPMMIKNKRKGLILLGNRITKQTYSKSDIEYISSIAGFAIISIENSRLFKETLEKEKLEKDLEIARSIQINLLPSKMPISDKYQISASNNSAKQVGGDFFDVVELDEDKLLIAIADVSGKGIQASLLMANLQAFLKSIYKQNYNLAEASNFVNDLVSENTTNGSFITFFWGILNTSTKEFTYVNMGHNPPLLVRKDKISKLKKGGMILGVMKTLIPYESEIVQLEKNDTVILFTDGVTEAMNNKKEEYGDERFENLCLSNVDENADDLLKIILDDVDSHAVGAMQSDDITAMVLKIK